MPSNIFNTIDIDYNSHTIIKSSENTSKLRNEINYYLNLPKSISAYFPALIEYKEDYSAYVSEYIPYRSLAELFISDELTLSKGKKILNTLLIVLKNIHSIKNTSPQDVNDICDFYINKTFLKIEQLKENPFFIDLLRNDYLIINDVVYKNFSLLQDEFIQKIQSLTLNNHVTTAIHGDFSFNNILYCVKDGQIKLINPRGSFVSNDIYGHPYYDFAKLLHSLHGGYDLIINNDFELEYSEEKFYFSIKKSLLLEDMCIYYLNALKLQGVDLNLLFIIQSSFFLSSKYLGDDKNIQRALFLKGIIMLNNTFNGHYENLY